MASAQQEQLQEAINGLSIDADNDDKVLEEISAGLGPEVRGRIVGVVEPVSASHRPGNLGGAMAELCT
jgi:hypothetical protein